MSFFADQDPVVIVGARRTPMGAFQGALSALRAPALGGVAIRGALEGLDGAAAQVEAVFMGCVLPAGLGQAPARQAAHAAGLSRAVPCTTINKMCGSAMEAAILAVHALQAGAARVVVAGGMESMSNAPYLLDRARGGYRLGHGAVLDHMFFDGLEDAYERGRLMGTFAEDTAQTYGFDRATQDAYALRSLARAQAAQAEGAFAAEIVPVTVPGKGKGGDTVVTQDETPTKADPARIPTLKPAFRADGTVTAANSSSISDGAAALVLTRASVAAQNGWPVLAVVRGQAVHAQEPAWFTTAPIGACRRLLDRVGWTKDEVEAWEINEAFAVVSLAAIRDLDLDPDRVNSLGGACALGHPIGASGARIIVTLLNALQRRDQRRGIASLCIGGGEATALAIERPV